LFRIPPYNRDAPQTGFPILTPKCPKVVDAGSKLAEAFKLPLGDQGEEEAMKLYGVWAVSVCWSGLALAGCSKPIVARYIYQDSEFGVVGIPVNTYQKKVDFRAQAEVLMARHFPEGYEIVRAEEVIEGERILDVGKKTEIETEPGFAALHQVLKL